MRWAFSSKPAWSDPMWTRTNARSCPVSRAWMGCPAAGWSPSCRRGGSSGRSRPDAARGARGDAGLRGRRASTSRSGCPRAAPAGPATRLARGRLGRARSSVFPAPPREVLAAPDYAAGVRGGAPAHRARDQPADVPHHARRSPSGTPSRCPTGSSRCIPSWRCARWRPTTDFAPEEVRPRRRPADRGAGAVGGPGGGAGRPARGRPPRRRARRAGRRPGRRRGGRAGRPRCSATSATPVAGRCAWWCEQGRPRTPTQWAG